MSQRFSICSRPSRSADAELLETWGQFAFEMPACWLWNWIYWVHESQMQKCRCDPRPRFTNLTWGVFGGPHSAEPEVLNVTGGLALLLCLFSMLCRCPGYSSLVFVYQTVISDRCPAGHGCAVGLPDNGLLFLECPIHSRMHWASQVKYLVFPGSESFPSCWFCCFHIFAFVSLD